MEWIDLLSIYLQKHVLVGCGTSSEFHALIPSLASIGWNKILQTMLMNFWQCQDIEWHITWVYHLLVAKGCGLKLKVQPYYLPKSWREQVDQRSTWRGIGLREIPNPMLHQRRNHIWLAKNHGHNKRTCPSKGKEISFNSRRQTQVRLVILFTYIIFYIHVYALTKLYWFFQVKKRGRPKKCHQFWKVSSVLLDYKLMFKHIKNDI